MVFRISNNAANSLWMSWQVLYDAKTVILWHKITPGEQKLSNYLKEATGLDLKQICLYLIGRCKLYRDKNKNIIVLFPRKKDDKLASLITYGNEKIKGSNLLKEAFFRK